MSERNRQLSVPVALGFGLALTLVLVGCSEGDSAVQEASADEAGYTAPAQRSSSSNAPSSSLPSGPRMEEFRLLGAYELYLDGGLAAEAEIYHSKLANAFLVLDDALPAPFLLQPRSGSVETVDLMKVESQADGSIDLLPDPTLKPQGVFAVDGKSIRFTVEDIPVEMREKPDLLGEKVASDLATYDPEYVRRSELYTPSSTALAKLQGYGSDVRVRVFFGSWCPHCQQVVPRIMRVEEEIAGSNIAIEYYGLPRDMNDDKAKALGIRSVPTGVVYRGGEEIGRLSGNGWKYPEATLAGLIEG